MRVPVWALWCAGLWALLFAAGLRADSEPVFQRFGVAHGLSQVSVQGIAEDSRGLLWVGTQDGLNRFDGYRFSTLRHRRDDPNSLSSDRVNAVLTGLDGRIWVLTSTSLDAYDPRTERFERLPHSAQNHQGFSGRQVRASLRDARGRLWFATPEGLIRFDPESRQYRSFQPWRLHDLPAWSNEVRALAEAPGGTLWVASQGGLQWFDTEKEQFRFSLPDWLHRLGGDLRFTFLHATGNGVVYAADGDHLHRFDVTRQQHQMWTLAEVGLLDTPNAMQVMPNGDEWLGSSRGLFHRPAGASQFRLYAYHGHDPDALPGEYVTRLHVDRAGNLWVGTYTGGLARLSANAAHVRYYRAMPDALGRPVSPAVNMIAPSPDGGLVAGNFDGMLMHIAPQTEQVSLILPHPAWRPDTVPRPWLNDIEFDRQGRLWIATTNGAFRIDANKQVRAWFGDRKRGGSPVAYWVDMAIDARDDVWMLSPRSGLYRYRAKEDDFQLTPIAGVGEGGADAPVLARVRALSDGWLWIAAELPRLFAYHPVSGQQRAERLVCASQEKAQVHHLDEDAKGHLLIGSANGLYRFDPATGACEAFTDANGLANPVVNGALSDANGRFWLATNRGVSRVDPETRKVDNFSAADGLHHGEFNAGAAVRLGDKLYFGGINGVLVFDPANLKHVATSPAVLLTDLMVNYQPWVTSTEARSVSVGYLEQIGLAHDENSLAIGFAAADLSAPEDYLYAWRLKGFRDDWVETTPDRRLASYTGLPPGRYSFEVKARRAGHDWGPTRVLGFHIQPAWWQRTWARAAAASLLLLLTAGVGAALVLRLRRRNVWLEKAVAERTRRINELMAQRTRLFANMSHELRTPLTLVLSPLSELRLDPAAAALRERLDGIYRHAKRLASLIDDVLAIARLQDPNTPPPPSVRVPLRLVLLSVLEAFQPVAARAGVLLRWQRIDDVSVECPPDDPSIIVGNLLTNAIKYTDPGGHVDVALVTETAANGQRFACLQVRDTGIGIPDEQIQQIFEPFFRGAQARPTPDALAFSSGFGLAHVRELVTRMGGRIEVNSTAGVGSTFAVRLPAVQEQLDPLEVVATPAAPLATELPAVENNDNDWERRTLLIVEDNVELNAYIAQLFAPEFDVLTATDGESGERLAFEHLPDLVISDIRLPGMDGLALAERLKTDVRSSHIPIILLTAVADHEVRIRGLAIHVDDYIGKPFHVDELRQRVNNLLLKQAALKNYFQRDMAHVAETGEREPTAETPAALTETDRRFLRHLDDVLHELLENAELDLPQIAARLYLSKKQVQRKVRALTGLTPMEYLRQVRLRRAAELLKQGEVLSRVVYAVGFSSQSYFTTCFKQAMGLTPKAWQQKQTGVARDRVEDVNDEP